MAQNKENEQSLEKSPVALREERILAYWQEKDIFKKTQKKNEGEEEFVFYDGPPFATGTPHFGHMIPGTMKDVIPRYQTMRGKYVSRRWGWDCHGLPIENLIEKELNLNNKKEIEELGIEKFNQAARASVFRYADVWKRVIPRTGRFVDMETGYTTMDSRYTESVWWAFKELFNKDLVYEGFKSMQLCPRCETTLSNFEVNQGYKDITDISVYAKFKLEKFPATYLVAWTTTPWTLPGNVALAVNPGVTYVEVQQTVEGKEEHLIFAKDRLSAVKDKLAPGWNSVKEYEGSELVGESYVPVFDYYLKSDVKNKENAWKVYGADFVTIVDGTGIVHIAPAFGNDDYELSVKENLPFIQHVTSSGVFKDEVTEFKGQNVKPKDDHQKADIEIIKNLAPRGLLFAKEKIIHSYPHCWRCDTPLLNYATSSWFIKVTTLKDSLIRENNKVQWLPESIKDGRFGKWLQGARDWAVSRSRFWGAPIPVWKCEECKKEKVVGSIKEIKEGQKEKNTIFVMRHGQSENNEKNIVSSDIKNNPGLTEIGKEGVRKSAESLKKEHIDLIVVSPFNRALQTAEIVRETLGLSKDALVIDENLREINAGEFNGKSVENYHGFFKNIHERFIKCPQGGETYIDLKKRITKFFYSLNAQHKGTRILIISHDSPLWLLTAGIEALNELESLELRGESKFFFNNAEVRKLSAVELPHNENYELDLHRPYIDSIILTCVCGGEMKRVPEVFDTWFDSGSVPFASFHYPFENKDKFNPKSIPVIKKSHGFPAHFIAEGLDQTRGWFYTMLVLSVGLFNKTPYRNVVVNGLLLAEDGRKMSKRLKNYPELDVVMDRFGADALRYYLMSSPVVHAEDVRFSEKGVDEVYKKNILRLDNVVSFYEMYKSEVESVPHNNSTNLLDQWIIARLNETRKEMANALDAYQIDRGAWPIEKFIDDLSTWYLRRSRDRLKGEDVNDKARALNTLQYVLIEFAKVIAPYIPFIADDIYMRVGGELESVHLENWIPDQSINGELLTNMKLVRDVVSLGLEARAKAGVKVRQPLNTLTIKNEVPETLLYLIKEEVNIKNVQVDSSMAEQVVLDIDITQELKYEGYYRDLVRAVQELRKEMNLVPNDRVTLVLETSKDGEELVKQFKDEIQKVAGIKDIDFKTNENGKVIKIESLEFKVSLLK